MSKPTCCQDSAMNRMRARAEKAERELADYQAKACEDLEAAWRERDEARDKLADCESYHLECGDCGKMQTFIGKGLFECYSCAWREASEEVRVLQAKLAEAETFKREWGEAHNRLTALTDELLGPAPTMPLLALIERLERADPRAQLAKTEAVVEAARSVIKEMWRLPESSMLRTKLHVLAGVLRDLDEDSPVGVAATAEDGHEAPAQNRQPVEPPSDPATGTTRREPPETAIGGSTGAVIQAERWHRLTSDPAEPGDAGSNPAPTGSSGTPGPTGGAIPPAVACGLMHVRCANCTDYIDRENAHDCTRGKNACGECDQEPCACPDPQAPATRAELEELRREILTTLSDALERIHIPVPGSSGWAEVPPGLRELAEELRRRIERLETKE